MRKVRLLSLLVLGSLAVTLVCMIGILGGQANERIVGPVPKPRCAFAILHSFAGYPKDGANPLGSLTLSGATFYGTTGAGGGKGGPNGNGAIFKFDTETKAEKVLYSFTGYPGDPNDGFEPVGNLILSGTTLYGMTSLGGANSVGTIFEFDTKKNVEKLLHSFGEGRDDGAYPAGSLILSGTVLYGMTSGGGANGQGTIFKFDTNTNVATVLYSFAGYPNDGGSPEGSLTLESIRILPPALNPKEANPSEGVLRPLKTILYGMTLAGGSYHKGAIFKFDPETNVETVLYSFGETTNDGARPWGSLILSGTTLYGMTQEGGDKGQGAIFMFDTKTNAETVLYSFGEAINDGAAPKGDLILSGTTLYGMTTGGGAKGQGAIFMFNTETNVETVLYSFAGVNESAEPLGSLTLVGTTLYGMTFGGGTNNPNDIGLGTIFSIPLCASP